MDARDERASREKMIDFFLLFLYSFYIYCVTVLKRCRRLFRKLSQNEQITELFSTLNDKFAKYPLLRYMALATSLSCAVPVIMFLAFGLVSIVVTFSGFLFIEGTLLAIGGLCMFVYLGMMVLLMSIMTLMLGVLYLSAQKLGILLNRFEGTSGIWSNFGQTPSQSNGVLTVSQPHQD